MNLYLTAPVSGAISLLEQAGWEAYAVGGCVRDLLLGNIPHDWDITTSASPSEMKAVFRDFPVLETGIQHGTLTVLWNGEPLEITTFRTEGNYSDGRHPDSVSFSRRLRDDLSRRDFTVNAMAYNPRTGLVDCFGGQDDLTRHCIRCVGNSDTRFGEDALRILRALRFSAQLGFTIDSETSDALFRCYERLSLVSVERKSEELKKLLCGKNAPAILERYSAILSTLLPVSPDSPRLLSRLPQALPLRLTAVLSHCTPLERQEALTYLRFDNATRKTVTALSEALAVPLPTTLPELRKALGKWGTLWQDVFTLREAFGDSVEDLRKEAAAVFARGDCLSIGDLAINGRDLTDLGFSGAEIRQMLSALLEAVMEDWVLNEHTALLEYAICHRVPHLAKTKR